MPPRPHNVAILGLGHAIGYDITIAPLIFGIAEDERGNPLYRVKVCGVDRSPIPIATGYEIIPEFGQEALDDADTVIIPGTEISGLRQDGTLPHEVAAAVARIRPGTRIMSICTGAFVLGAAGLLNGRPATTHWKFTKQFRALFPDVMLDEDVLFVDDGDVLTSAGLGAGLDLCLHVVRRDHGSEVANQVARHCVVPPWRQGGQAQFIERQEPDDGADCTAPTRAWALGRLGEPLELSMLAAHARMSVRSFSRKFRAETGISPGAWLIQQRIRHAQHLLETTDLPVDQVAQAAGMGTAASLRQHLRATLGVSPLAYRHTFRAR